jgi:hypothetical protein
MQWHPDASYKTVIRDRVRECKGSGSALTLKRVAEKIPLQYTYFSKVLNQPDVHLNADQIHRVGEILGLSDPEQRFLCLLHTHQTTSMRSRKDRAYADLDVLRKRISLSAAAPERPSGEDLLSEMSYLFDPICIVAAVAFSIERYRKDPRLLAPLFGVSNERIRECIGKLESAGLVARGPGLSVTRVSQKRSHLEKTHPLMRTHQHLLRLVFQDRLMKTSEEFKESFQATFTSDVRALPQFREEFRKFVTALQKISVEYPSKDLFSVSLDLFRWND